MKIAIDGRMLHYSGIGRYIRNLAENISEIDRKNTYCVLLNSDDYAGLTPARRDGRSNLEYRAASYYVPVYSMREHWLLPFEIRRLESDIVHYPSFNTPLFWGGRFVVTIHDLIYYLYPGLCPGRFKHYYAKAVFRAVSGKAERIIAVSAHTKNDIVRHLGVDPRKVEVIYNGVDGIYAPEKDERKMKAVMEKYGIKGEYVLYVGSHGENKNLLRLVEAYAMMKARGSCRLVIGGKIDPRRRKLYEAPGRLGVADSVTFAGHIPDEDLPALYSMASIFVFPSLYEGFGFPPLEAMACGAPVVCSNSSSLPEVTGDAALMFDPLDTGDMARKMDEALSNTGLRSELKEKGFRRAAAFSWREAAVKTLKVYEEVYRA